ncbi:MAG: 2'-5' RNA ligase family protein [Clostridia bacterium]|jgi:2'-5' RNA ligase|nr:2'-5' RNA ligase family protein [Clostridia bacterium]
MITRCVHIFPKFKEAELLHDIREKYDYLHKCIEPHITLVFPFESNIETNILVEDIKSTLKGYKSFKVIGKGIQGIDNYGYYLFLNIEEGSEIIKELHYSLHKGILKNYQSEWTKDGSFKPHVTIGRFKDRDEMLNAAKLYENIEVEYEAFIDKVYIEIIGENEESIIEKEIGIEE